jgi:CheY-like chemotaxis protein
MTLKTVMVIDDCEADRYLIGRQLKKTQLIKDIINIGNAESALSLLKSGSDGEPKNIPDIILLDINMPLMSGFDFLTHLDALSQASPSLTDIRVYMVSSSVSRDDKSQAASHCRIFGYITKPPSIDELTETLMN